MIATASFSRECHRPTRDELILNHLGFARILARRLLSRFPSWVDAQDLESDAYLGLFEAAQSFDPSRQVSFRTYAARRIIGAVLDGVRERSYFRRSSPSLCFQSLNIPLPGETGSYETLADTIADRSEPVGTALEMRDEAEFVLRRLDAASRKHLNEEHIEGLNYRQIAARLGITPSAVSLRMKKIRNDVREIRSRAGGYRRA